MRGSWHVPSPECGLREDGHGFQVYRLLSNGEQGAGTVLPGRFGDDRRGAPDGSLKASYSD